MKSNYVELTDVGKSRLNVEEIDTDDLRDNEAIIRAEYSLISAGTELSRAFALKKGFKYPVRPGYSMVGRIVKKGRDIKAEEGDRVFANCPHASLVRWSDGDDVQGPFIRKLPEGIDPKEATIINLGLVAMQGVELTDVRPGYTVGVFGLGNIGILTALMYRKMGCRVIGLDIVSERCLLARTMGIEDVVDCADQKEAIDELTDGKGLDIAVDVTGLSPVIIKAIECAKAYGQVLLLGSPRQSYETDVTGMLSNIHMKDLKVLGGFNKTVPMHETEGYENCMDGNFDKVCGMIMNRDLDISKMISDVIDPADCEKAYYDLMYNKDRSSCIIYDWSRYGE